MRLLFLMLIISSALFAQDVEVFTEKTDTTINFYAKSPHYCHYTVDIQFEVFDNMTSSLQLPARLVVPPLSQKHFLLSIKRKPEATNWRYKVQYRFTQGNLLNTKHNDQYVYTLPYQSSRQHKLMQGYFGMFSHTGIHALDFEMPEGTKIVAARDGVVIDIKEDSDIGGATEDFIDKANYVIVYHDDGTFASYFHLKKNGALVDLGQKVNRGEAIALSGNTGWSSAPHLHFEVLLPSDEGKKTLPTKFILINGKTEALQEGNSY